LTQEVTGWNKTQIGKRCIYTDRSGKEHHGVVRDVVEISSQSGHMIDVNVDSSTRSRCYCPADMVKLV
jgi:hypothetical protein